jgi:hypothetical protein
VKRGRKRRFRNLQFMWGPKVSSLNTGVITARTIMTSVSNMKSNLRDFDLTLYGPYLSSSIHQVQEVFKDRLI